MITMILYMNLMLTLLNNDMLTESSHALQLRQLVWYKMYSPTSKNAIFFDFRSIFVTCRTRVHQVSFPENYCKYLSCTFHSNTLCLLVCALLPFMLICCGSNSVDTLTRDTIQTMIARNLSITNHRNGLRLKPRVSLKIERHLLKN